MLQCTRDSTLSASRTLAYIDTIEWTLTHWQLARNCTLLNVVRACVKLMTPYSWRCEYVSRSIPRLMAIDPAALAELICPHLRSHQSLQHERLSSHLMISKAYHTEALDRNLHGSYHIWSWKDFGWSSCEVDSIIMGVQHTGFLLNCPLKAYQQTVVKMMSLPSQELSDVHYAERNTAVLGRSSPHATYI